MTTANIQGISEGPGKQRIQVESPVNIASDRESEDRLLDLWYQLLAEHRAMMKFIWAEGDSVINYALIAANMTMPRLPGDDRSEVVSEKTTAKYGKTLMEPPLQLLRRSGKRSGIMFTAKGARLMRLVAKGNL
jgi:hypothetical protein